MKCILFLVFGLLSVHVFAQQAPVELDKSPMDLCYWPHEYPQLKTSGQVKGDPVARILYGRPQKAGRTIFGGIVKYNEVWRLGANEATEVEFFRPVKINGKIIPKGRYTLFCIPQEKKWTLILNLDHFIWGSFLYNNKRDLLRVDVVPEVQEQSVENFTMFFTGANKSTASQLVILWDTLKVQLPISY
ncbi:MAG: DUF2911 domain-containing protein [Hydrotalea sp.]|nr:DUF2911 domain-containing protein [Hydrotalea sp.]